MKINSLLKLSAWLWPPTVLVTKTLYLMVTFITNTRKEIQSSINQSLFLKNGKKGVKSAKEGHREMVPPCHPPWW